MRRLAILTALVCGCPSPEAPSGPSPSSPEPSPTPELAAPSPSRPVASPTHLSFDDTPAGALPPGTTLAETNGAGAPAVWAVVADADAPSPPHAFGITQATGEGQIYNLAILDVPELANGELSVMVKPRSGEHDQGGGLAFRFRDPSNYYIARWNPLEKNVRFYVVENGARTALAKAEIELDPGKWQILRIVLDGDTLELFMEDRPLLRVTDRTFTGPGRVALWTKADAATLFDDVSITPH